MSLYQPPTQAPTPFRRWLDAFVALPERLRLPLALLLAVIVHGIGILIAWLWPLLVMLLVSWSLLPQGCVQGGRVATPPEKKKLEVTIVTPTPEPAQPKEEKPLEPAEEQKLEQLFAALPEEIQREYLDVEGLARRKNLSKRALLESWADSVAGTTRQGKDDSPLPAQEGRDDLPFINFKNQQATLGSPNNPPAPELKNDKPLPPAPAPPGGDPAPAPEPDTAAKVEPAKPEQPAPAASAEPPPVNLREVQKPNDGEIPLFVKAPALIAKVNLTPLPAPDPAPPKPEPKPTPVPLKPTPVPTPAAKLPTPPPKSEIRAAKLEQTPGRPMPVKDPGYSPHLEMRKVEGGKAPIGASGVDAVATTRGRYVKSLNQAVGSRWTYYVRDPRQASLITVGSVTLKFAIDAQGKLIRVKVTENTSNAAYAQLCERAFLESLPDFEKPPAELLRGGIFEDTFTFTLY